MTYWCQYWSYIGHKTSVKRPDRIGDRTLRKMSPHAEVGTHLRYLRECSEKTQWELAEAITDLLDLRSLLERQLPQQLAIAPYLDADRLETVKIQFSHIVSLASRVRSILQTSESAWISEAVSEILNVEKQIGRQIELARKRVGLTQDQLHYRIGEVLGQIGIAGPPGRAGVSKVERGARRMDLIEAWAAAIVFKCDISEILPPSYAALLPYNPDPMKGWHVYTLLGNCRQFRHTTNKGILTLASKGASQAPREVLNRALAGWDGAPRVSRGETIAVFERVGDLYLSHIPDIPGCVAYSNSFAGVDQLILEAACTHVRSLDGVRVEPQESISFAKKITVPSLRLA